MLANHYGDINVETAVYCYAILKQSYTEFVIDYYLSFLRDDKQLPTN
jgi:hypothetical protein